MEPKEDIQETGQKIERVAAVLDPLDPTQKNLLVAHDSGGMITALTGWLEEAGKGSWASQYNRLRGTGNTQGMVKCVQEMVEATDETIPEHVRAIGEIFPVLAASMIFLGEPNEANYRNLHDLPVKLSLISRVTLTELSEDLASETVPGEEAIVLFNLLKNARAAELKYSGQRDEREPIALAISKEGEAIRIVNRAKEKLLLPDPQTFPPVEEGIHGYGLRLAQIYAFLAGKQIKVVNEPLPEGGYQVTVIFGPAETGGVGEE